MANEMNVQRFYETYANIIGKRFGATVKVTVTRKPECEEPEKEKSEAAS